MDKKNIIEEGLLEKYLLGELSAEETVIVESALASDSDILEKYKAMEADFEKMAFENALDPPETVKEALMDKIDQDYPEVEPSKSVDQGNIQRVNFMMAAGLAALLGLGSVWMYNQWQTAEDNLKVVREQTSSLENRLSELEQNLEKTNSKYRRINNINVTPLVLKGQASKAVAYVNHESKEVVVNPQGLPNLDSDKTYQMWADVDGEMIDMGLLPTDRELVTLKYIDKAESLNITIEPAGGNDHATVENLVSAVAL